MVGVHAASSLTLPAAPCCAAQVSAFTDNHLPQPDVQGWQWRRAAALRQAEAVARRALQGAVAAATAGDAPAAAPQVAGWPRAMRSQPASQPGNPCPHLLHAGVLSAPGRRRCCRPLQVSPGEDFTAPPMPLEEWQDVYSDSLQATRATCAAAVAHATGPLQVCLLPLLTPAALLPCRLAHGGGAALPADCGGRCGGLGGARGRRV